MRPREPQSFSLLHPGSRCQQLRLFFTVHRKTANIGDFPPLKRVQYKYEYKLRHILALPTEECDWYVHRPLKAVDLLMPKGERGPPAGIRIRRL